MKAYTIGNLAAVSGIPVIDHPKFGMGVTLEDKVGNMAYHVQLNKDENRRPPVNNAGIMKIFRAYPVFIKQQFYILGKEEKETPDVLALFIGYWRIEKGEPALIAAAKHQHINLKGNGNTRQALVVLPLGTVVEIGDGGNKHFIEITETGPKTFGYLEYLKRMKAAAPGQPVPALVNSNSNGAKASANGHTVTATPNVGVPIVLANGQLIEINGVPAIVTLENGLIVVTNL